MKEVWKKEVLKTEDPYTAWLEEHESWRGDEVSKELRESFLKHYTLKIPADAVNDPDLVSRFALYAAGKDYDLIYCDEDVIQNGKRINPWFKPDYSPDTALSCDYIGELKAVGREYEKRVQNGDPALAPGRVCHIPEVLYHASKERLSFSKDQKEPVPEQAEAGFNQRLSMIMLSKDHPDMFRTCVNSLITSGLPEKTELVLIDNGSSGQNRIAYEKMTEEYGIRYYYRPMPFNYSALCNLGARMSGGDLLLFLNDDIEAPEEAKGFLSRLCCTAEREHVGAAGIKLLYPGTDRIQHCGITILKSGPSHKLCGYDDFAVYGHGVNRTDMDVAAVTGACLCIRREVFFEAGGFDEELPVAYNDVDLCLRLLYQGLYNVSLNSIYLYHHESATRTDDRSDLKSYARLKADRLYFEDKHEAFIKEGDPFYSPNLTRTGLDYLPDVPMEWEESGTENAPLKITREKMKGRKICSHLDKAGYKLSDAYGNEDFWEVTGWIFQRNGGSEKYRPGVMIIRGEKKMVFQGARLYRKDVADMFGKEKDACMSGFCVRIAHALITEEELTGDIIMKPVLIDKKGIVCQGEEECRIRID